MPGMSTQVAQRTLVLAGCAVFIWSAGVGAQSDTRQAGNAPTMSVEAAYRAIPHRRSPFNPSATQMGTADRLYVAALLGLVDEAIVQRVGALEWMRSGGQRGVRAERYVSILERLEAMDVPARLSRVHRLVTGAIRQQYEAMRDWQETSRLPDPQHDPRVSRASASLREASGALLRLFPGEGQRTRDAFHDALSALDFL